MKKRRIGMVGSVVLCILVLLLLGPLDVFTHGFFPNEIMDAEQITDAAFMGQIRVDDENCVVTFSPQKDHFAGVELYLVNHSSKSGGVMTMTISDSSGTQVDAVNIDLGKVQEATWYKVSIHANLKKGGRYTARFVVSGTQSIPAFLRVDPSCLGAETVEGNVFLNYAYKVSTFSGTEKVLLGMLVLAGFGIAIYFLVPNEKYRKVSKVVILGLVLTVGMTWNYMYNSFDNQNVRFTDFQIDSETLVTGAIYAERDGVYFQAYGLGRYYTPKGALYSEDSNYLSDDNWLDGYSRTVPAILTQRNSVTQYIAVVGNTIRFQNGEEYQITEVSEDGDYIEIYLNAEHVLSQVRNGSIDNTQFYDENHSPLPKTFLAPYVSQYGLQGQVFRRVARYMNQEKAIAHLRLICALATALVFVLIVFLLAMKYNPLFAGCFYVVFALSPWVVNFARNLYWVEFTWFIPMAIGLICALKIESKDWRIRCYLATFIAIAGKCLCGYEYISVVMMGLVAFLVVDLLLAVVNRDTEKAKLLFRTTFILGIIALAGFMAAICIHAPLKSGGGLLAGIRAIIEQDVLRRTSGADLNSFDPVLWPSMNASVWEVYCKYFHFSTEIIAGIPGNLFPLLCVIPIVIFVYEFQKKKMDYCGVFMYVFFFLTSISWFCLAKSHSYIHTHMSYVLWYFGFVQTCLYVIVSRIVNMVSTRKNTEAAALEGRRDEKGRGQKT